MSPFKHGRSSESPPPPTAKRPRRSSSISTAASATDPGHPTHYGPPPPSIHSQSPFVFAGTSQQGPLQPPSSSASGVGNHPGQRTAAAAQAQRLRSASISSSTTHLPPQPPPSVLLSRTRSSSTSHPGATSSTTASSSTYQYRYPPLPPHPPPNPSHPSVLLRSVSYGHNSAGAPGYPTPTYIHHHPPGPPTTTSLPGASMSSSHTNGPRVHGDMPPSSSSAASLSNSSAMGLPPLSLSILGVEPLDEFIKEVADFVHHMIVTRPEHLGGVVEVEAKIGLIVDRAAGGRLKLPVLVETVLDPNAPLDIRFESNMSSTQHRHYNTLLNSLKTDQPTASPLDYSHLYLLDNFFPAPSDPASDSGRGGDKVRVTRDEKTSQVVQCVKKIRLGDLNVWSPHHKADWRVSVNLEVPVQHPLGSPSYTRRKDRMRYTHEEFVIDLTQVTTHSAPNAPPQQILHELELEIARPELLLATAAKRNDVTVSEHERSAFDELIRAFVNNARILVKNSMTEGGW